MQGQGEQVAGGDPFREHVYRMARSAEPGLRQDSVRWLTDLAHHVDAVHALLPTLSAAARDAGAWDHAVLVALQVLFQWMGRFWEQSAASQRQTVTELLAALGTHCVEGPETAAARIAVRCIARLWVLAPSTEARLPLPRFGLAARLALLREVALDTELCPAAATDAKCRAFRHALASHVARQARPQVLAAATTALRDGPPVQHAAAFHALRAWASTAAALLPPPPCDQAVAAAAAAGGEPLLDTAHQFHRALEAACSAVGADDERAALRIGALAPVLGPALHGATAGLDAAEDGPEPCDAGAADAAADCIVDALAWHSPEEAFLAVEGDDADLADLAAVRGIARELGLRVGAIAAAAGQHAPTARQRRALRAASKLVGALLEGHSHVTLCSQEALAAARGEAGAASRAKEEAQALVTATCALLTGPWDEGAGSALVLVSGCSQAIFRAISAAADEAQGATHPASGPDPSPAVAVACELVDAVAARAVAAPSGDAAQQYNSQPGGRRGAGELATLASTQLWCRLTDATDPDGAVPLCTECIVDAVAEAAIVPGLPQRLLARLGCVIASAVPAPGEAEASPGAVHARVRALALASAVARELACAADADAMLRDDALGEGYDSESDSGASDDASAPEVDEDEAAAVRMACEWWLALAPLIAPPGTGLDHSALFCAAAALAEADAVALLSAGGQLRAGSPATPRLFATCAAVMRHAPSSVLCEAVSARLLGALARVRSDEAVSAPFLQAATAAGSQPLASPPHALNAAYAAPMAALQTRAALVAGARPPSWLVAVWASPAVTRSVAAALKSRKDRVAARTPEQRSAWAAVAAEWARSLPQSGPNQALVPRVALDALRLVAAVGDPVDVAACASACLGQAQRLGPAGGPWLAARVLHCTPADDAALAAGQSLLRSAGAAALQLTQDPSVTWEEEEGDDDDDEEEDDEAAGRSPPRALAACASLARELLRCGGQDQWELAGQWAAEAVRAAAQRGIDSPSLWTALGALCSDVMQRQLSPALFSALVAVPLVWGQRVGSDVFKAASASLAAVLHPSHPKREGVLRVLRRHVVDGVPWQHLGAAAPGREHLHCMAAILCHPRSVADARSLKRTLVLLATTPRTDALRQIHASLEAPTAAPARGRGHRGRIEPVLESISTAALG